jgi:hypothetical protein
MKKTVVLFIFVLQYLTANGQGQNDVTHLPNVMPVSPKAYEIQKYIDVPVSKYTGVPSITIPIYTIQTNGLSMPITLSYHSNGVKVNEEASWVGLGWSLFSGGSITQIVKGYDDFGFFKWRDNEARAIFDACMYDPATYGERFDVWVTRAAVNPVTPGANPDLIEFSSDGYIIAGTRDAEPDLFKFSMLGYSGEFILDWHTGFFKCITDSNIKIEAKGAVGNAFVIKTPDGNVFEFENIEETIISGASFENSNNAPGMDPTNLLGQKSSRNYQLTAIYTSKGDKITLNYLPATSPLETLPALSSTVNTYLPIPTVPLATTLESFKTINYSKQTFCYLSSIIFPGGSVNFYSTADRLDFSGTSKLNSIVLKNDLGIAVKTFDFTYDYFIGDAPSNTSDSYLTTAYYTSHKSSIELTHRLKLLSFKESGIPPNTFEYDQTKLPEKTSYAFDHWGYYNGKISSDLNPTFQGLSFKAVNLSSPFDIVGINRSSDSLYTKAFILNKINYPTGGHATFKYEPNSFNNLKVQDDAHSTSEMIYLSDNNTNSSVSSRAYIVDASAYSGVDAENLNLNTYGSESVPDIGMNTYIRLAVIKKTPENIALMASSGSYLFWNKYFSTSIGQLSTQVNDVISDTKIVSLDFNSSTQQYETFKLIPNYHIDIDPDKFYIIETHLYDAAGPQNTSTSGPHSSVSGYFHINKNRPYNSSESSLGAGLRIKKVETFDNAGWKSVKNYKYDGGILMGPIRYLKTISGNINELINEQETIWGFIQKNTVTSSSFFPLSTSGSGNFVGYYSVSEGNTIVDNNGNINDVANGSIVDFYTNQPDVTVFNTHHDSRLFVYPPEKNSIDNGLSVLTSFIDKDGNTIKKIENFYSEAPYDKSTWSYGRLSANAGSVKIEDFSIDPPIMRYFGVTSVGFYPIFAKRTLLDSTRTTISNVNQNTTSTISYEYDSHNQINHSWEKNSINKILHTYNKYPYDFNSGTFLSLVGLGIISPIIEQKKFVDSQETLHIKNDYQIDNSLIYPVFTTQKIEASFKGAILEDKYFYNYGDAGQVNQFKLTQFFDVTKPVSAILWGYNGQYPVAEITGSSYSAIQSLISQNMLDNAQNYSDAQIRTELNKIRLGLSGTTSTVTTYTYKPLVGMTSMTDAKGQTTYYEYDNNQRLMNVKDQYGNILKHNDYHYAGQ